MAWNLLSLATAGGSKLTGQNRVPSVGRLPGAARIDGADMNNAGRWGWASIATLVAIVMAGAAEAHTLGVAAAGFSAGLAHPFAGIDHLLAMIGIGLWAVQLAERSGRASALYLVPAAFLVMMAVGGVAAMTGLPLPEVETGILGSVVVLGLLIAVAPQMPVAAGMAIAGVFALFHGHAHGGELPEAASATLYALGFLLATTFLHAIGVALGLILQNGRSRLVGRLGGAGIAAAGVALYIFG
jgi:urease accessory protein